MSKRRPLRLLAATFVATSAACTVTSAPAPSHPDGPSPRESAYDRNETAQPPARPAPRPERPERPERPRPPERPNPPARACDRSAPLLYAETTRSLKGSREVTRRLVIRERGAWSLTAGDDETRGCLERGELAELENELEGASFDPPPPPDVTCMAMPTERIVYEDAARDRRAAIERPCGGTPLNPSVASASSLAASLTGTSPDDPSDGEPPRACEAHGPHLASIASRPLAKQESDRRVRRRGATRVRVATDGSWVRREGDAVTCGTLSRDELRALRATLRRADIGTTNPAIQCRALPTTEHRLATRGERATWRSPCGGAVPTEDTRDLADELLELVAEDEAS